MHITILGCGQLSQMLAQAGIPLGFTFSFLADEGEDTRCVDGLGAVVTRSEDLSTQELYELLGSPDRITVEKEQVDTDLLQALQSHAQVYPPTQAISICQHRYREKTLLDEVGIPFSDYIYNRPIDLISTSISLPVVVKSCSEGYDGKNQWVLKTQQDIEHFSRHVTTEDYIVEQWVPFDKEVSQVSVRGSDGSILHYPLTENRHEQGILKQSIAPATGVSEEIELRAQDYIQRIMEALDYVGVMAMECFLVGDKLLINELAPRVHNSGHWTQEGSATCQFENHIRAISGEPLGDTTSTGVTGMVNLIGTEKPSVDSLVDAASLHWYGKVIRPGRKLGHINISSEDHDSLRQKISLLNESNRSIDSDKYQDRLAG